VIYGNLCDWCERDLPLRHRTNKARAEGVGKPRRNPRQQGTPGCPQRCLSRLPDKVAQPALSRQIQNLEEEIGFKLFERLPRGVKITAAGEFLLKEARRILQEVNDATASAKRIASGQAGTFPRWAIPNVYDRLMPLETFNATLRTEVASMDGLLRRAQRETVIRLFPLLPGETATLYELGIPVVETGDRWHCDIGQKVPLTLDRENVPPGFLR